MIYVGLWKLRGTRRPDVKRILPWEIGNRYKLGAITKKLSANVQSSNIDTFVTESTLRRLHIKPNSDLKIPTTTGFINSLPLQESLKRQTRCPTG